MRHCLSLIVMLCAHAHAATVVSAFDHKQYKPESAAGGDAAVDINWKYVDGLFRRGRLEQYWALGAYCTDRAVTAEAVRHLAKGSAKQLSEGEIAGLAYANADAVRALLADKSSAELGATAVVATIQNVRTSYEATLRAESWLPDDKVLWPAPVLEKAAAAKKPARRHEPWVVRAASRAWTNEITALLTSGKKDLVEYGMAAVAASDHPTGGFTPLVATLDADHGSIPGLRLLFAVRTQQSVDAEMVEAAFKAKGGRSLKDQEFDVSRQDVLLPAAVSACQALELMGSAAAPYIEYLHKAATDKDIRIKIAAVRALAHHRDAETLEVLHKLLKKDDWNSVVPVCATLAVIADVSSIDPLIDRLKKEAGRLRLDLVYALNAIVGEQTYNSTYDEWKEWRDGPGAQCQSDPERSAAFRAQYRVIDTMVPAYTEMYGVKIWSDKVMFVVDSSGSMVANSRIDDLRTQMTEILTALGEVKSFTCNLIDYGGDVRLFGKGMTSKVDKLLHYIVHDMSLTYGTRHLDAFIAAFEQGGYDTVIFLTDGGGYAAADNAAHRLQQRIARITEYRPLMISTISFQAGEFPDYNLQCLSSQNGGEHSSIK
ncbi:MAG: HEAT repeat domain-containing protein [Planctomycetota bacterium]